VNEQATRQAWASWTAMQPKYLSIEDEQRGKDMYRAFAAGARWAEARCINAMRTLVDTHERERNG
jgi:hypothetical protein